MEFHANSSTDVGDDLICEEVDIRGNGTSLCYMDKPSKDGQSPDCWSTNTKNLDPHYSSGALNHRFCMAAEGSGAKTINGVGYDSPTCGGAPAVTGAGRTNVEKVWYRSLSTKLTSGGTYAAARNGAVGWTGTAGPITSSASRPARTGSWKAWLGGNGSTSTETIQQTVTIPSTVTAATLSFWLRTDTAESGSTVYDTMRVQVVDGATTSTLATYSNVGTNATYTQKSFNLTAYQGKTVTVKLLASEDSSLQTSFVVDDTSLATS